MHAESDSPSLGDIARQLEEIKTDIREVRQGFVPAKSWEEWRRENYGPRVERIELAADRIEQRVDNILDRINGRFRSNTMAVVQNVIYPIIVMALAALLITSHQP